MKNPLTFVASASKAVIFFICIAALLSFSLIESNLLDVTFKSWLLKRIDSSYPVQYDEFEKIHPHAKKVVYILGGSQDSLRYRFMKATELYKNGKARKILILSMPGITEYDPSLKRNLTNDEWSMRQLEYLGVQKEDMEAISLPYGLFGTLNEAQGVSKDVARKNYDVLILVSSSYHTARVRESFTKYLKGQKVKVFIYGANDAPPTLDLLIEYFKLMFYKNILL